MLKHVIGGSLSFKAGRTPSPRITVAQHVLFKSLSVHYICSPLYAIKLFRSYSSITSDISNKQYPAPLHENRVGDGFRTHFINVTSSFGLRPAVWRSSGKWCGKKKLYYTICFPVSWNIDEQMNLLLFAVAFRWALQVKNTADQ